MNPAVCAADWASEKKASGIDGQGCPLKGSHRSYRYPRRSLTQPKSPQLVMATDMRRPPGVTKWRNRAAAVMDSISSRSSSTRASANRRRMKAPSAMRSEEGFAGSSKRSRIELTLKVLGLPCVIDSCGSAADAWCLRALTCNKRPEALATSSRFKRARLSIESLNRSEGFG